MKKTIWTLALLALASDVIAAGIRNGCIPGTNGCGNCIDDPTHPSCIDPPEMPGVFFSDFDADGKNDLLFHHPTAGLKAWVKYAQANAGWLVFSPQGMGDPAWAAVGIGYFGPATGTPAFDRDTDVVWQNSQTGAVRIWQMSGNRRIADVSVTCGVVAPCTNPTAAWKVVATGHFGSAPGSPNQRDGKSDILFRNSTTRALKVWLMNGTTVAKEVVLTASMAAGWEVVGTGFFDKQTYDPWSDIAWVNNSSGEVQVWIMKLNEQDPSRGGTVVERQELVGYQSIGWNARGVTDLRQDGYPDILFLNSSTRNLMTWLMYGTTLMKTDPVTLPEPPAPWNPVSR